MSASQMRDAAVELINGRGGTIGTDIHEMKHAEDKAHSFPESAVTACNYSLNGEPCVYRNGNVCIITGSATPSRKSRLSFRQSVLKIEWQISMHCCHAKWHTTAPPHSPLSCQITDRHMGWNHCIRDRSERVVIWPQAHLSLFSSVSSQADRMTRNRRGVGRGGEGGVCRHNDGQGITMKKVSAFPSCGAEHREKMRQCINERTHL